MLGAYVSDLPEAEDMLALKRGRIKEYPCHRCLVKERDFHLCVLRDKCRISDTLTRFESLRSSQGSSKALV